MNLVRGGYLSLLPSPNFLSPTQENQLGSSFHIDTSDLKASSALIQDRIMAASLPTELESQLLNWLEREPFSTNFVAVRSSGTDEDSATHSFAGQSL